MIIHHDFETRSTLVLKKVGAYRYALHPTTEILLCAVASDEPGARVYLWVNPKYLTEDMDGSENEEAENLLAQAVQLYAHNVPFELALAWGIAQQGKASPFRELPSQLKYRCTAAMARKAGLPWGLDKLCEALHVSDGKDKEGKRLIELFSKPRKATKKRAAGFVSPLSMPDDWKLFGDYCRQDVRAERGVHHKLKPFELVGAQLATFQFDLRMNHRGIPINLEAARNAQNVIDEVDRTVTKEFRELTGLNPTQREEVKGWLERNGCTLPDMTADTIEEAVRSPQSSFEVFRALQLYQKLSFAAAKKIGVMLTACCPDGYFRGTMLFYGAGTGRWSGKLLQPHNFKKTPAWMRPMVDEIYRRICAGQTMTELQELEHVLAEPLELIAGIIRCFIHDPEGKILDGDFASVEARILCWLAGESEALAKWAKGEDLYCWMAGHIYEREITKDLNPDEREVGKRVILGCGYQMGWRKFQSSCRDQYGIELPDDLCKKCVKMFRKLHPKIREYWYTLDRQAKEAIKNPGHQCGPFLVRNICGIRYLLFKLRSGRSLAYPHPELVMEKYVDEDDLDDQGVPKTKTRQSITYWGELKPSTQWGRVKLYGGKLVENEDQATAADFMAHGAIVAESRGMPPFMLVHDQGVATCRGNQTAKDFEAALGTMPAWGKGMPLKVEAKILPYFKK